MSLKSTTALWVLLCCVCFSADSQEDYLASTREISVVEGLLHQRVHCAYSTQEGAWIGTQGGLTFFDGFTFQHWTKPKNGLSRNSVNKILEDQDGALWLISGRERSRKAIDILSVTRDSLQSFEEKFGPNQPFEVSEIQHHFSDQAKQLYFFAKDQLWKYQSAKGFSKIPLPEGFIPYACFTTGELAGKVGTAFAWLDKDHQLHLRTEYELKETHLYIFGSKDHFWVKQTGNHVLIYAPEDKPSQITYIKDEFGQSLFYNPYQNTFWVSNKFKIEVFDERGRLLQKKEFKRPFNVLEFDRFGTVWICSHYGLQLLRFERPKFKRFLHDPSENPDFSKLFRCRGLYKKDNSLLVNTYRGRQQVNLSTGKVISIDSLTNTVQLSRSFPIIADNDGYFWSASYKLIQWDKEYGSIKKEYEYNTDFDYGRGWSLFEDKSGKIWLGTNRGLFYYEDGELQLFKAYNGFNTLTNSIPLAFCEDRQDNIWLTTDSGLYLFDTSEGIMERYWNGNNQQFYLPSNDIQHLHQDTAGIYWLASADEGLIRWDKKAGTTQTFNRKDGFPSHNIYAVYEDDYGYLWMPSSYGLIRFHKETHSFQAFFKDDGISDNEFNRIAHFRGEDGTFYFGSQNGVTAFHPRDFRFSSASKQTTNLQLKSHRFFSTRGPELPAIDIDWDRKQLQLKNQVRFASFKVHYPDLFWTDQFDLHYQLERLDEQNRGGQLNGNYVSPDNIIRLVGLVPGLYRLRVEARRKNGGIYMAAPIGFTIDLPQPWNHQTWFRVLVVVLVLLLGFGIFQWRTKQLQKRQIELEQLVKERTESILANHQVIEKQALQIQQMQDQLDQKDQTWLLNLEQTVQYKLGNIHLDLSEIINDMGTSRSAFYEKVKELTNMTPNQYLQEARMQKALELLEQRACNTVKEVALSVGIKKPSYFSKLFKERFGKLPSTYF
ncbi:MAG: helix-turn-helix domain-containing protein [Bacteroidota bacterium]